MHNLSLCSISYRLYYVSEKFKYHYILLFLICSIMTHIYFQQILFSFMKDKKNNPVVYIMNINKSKRNDCIINIASVVLKI